MGEEQGTCCLVKTLKSGSVLVRVTCRKSDSPLDKESLTLQAEAGMPGTGRGLFTVFGAL